MNASADEQRRRITGELAGRFERALTALRASRATDVPDVIHPLLRRAEEDALLSQLADLRERPWEVGPIHRLDEPDPHSPRSGTAPP